MFDVKTGANLFCDNIEKGHSITQEFTVVVPDEEGAVQFLIPTDNIPKNTTYVRIKVDFLMELICVSFIKEMQQLHTLYYFSGHNKRFHIISIFESLVF